MSYSAKHAIIVVQEHKGLIWGPVIKLSTISNSENIDFTIESELKQICWQIVTRTFNFPKSIESINSFHTASELSVFGVFLIRIQSKCGKIQTRKTPNTDTFYAVLVFASIELCRWKSCYLKLFRHQPRCLYFKEQLASNKELQTVICI